MSSAVATPRKREMKEIPLHLIKPFENALRGVDRQSEEFLNLVHSVAQDGVLQPIQVREIEDPNGGASVYALVNGLQRFTAAGDCGLTVIPCMVLDIDETEVIETQIITNLIKVETKPAQYSHQLRRLLAMNPTWTLADLADRLSHSTAWLRERLNLTKLEQGLQDMVDEGIISVANGYALAKLPPEDQINFADRAQTEPNQSFTAMVASRVNELKSAKKEGREPKAQEFEPIERALSLGAIKAERSSGTNMQRILTKVGASTAEEGWKAALDFVVQMDPDAIEDQRAKYESRKAERLANNEKAKKERAAKKEREAAERQADLMNL